MNLILCRKSFSHVSEVKTRARFSVNRFLPTMGAEHRRHSLDLKINMQQIPIFIDRNNNILKNKNRIE